MEAFEFLLPLAVILLFSKLMGLGTHKCGMPAVIGMLIAGILLGLLQYIPWEPLREAFFGDEVKKVLSVMSKIGVVLIMFSAGLGTDLKKLKQTGVASVVITAMGVVVPMLLGFLVAFLFDFYTPVALQPGVEGTAGQYDLLSDIFYGAILTATSVSVTITVLKELGRLDSKVGTSIVAAAVIDDVIGI
ncbi:MAG: cation:proton antiporter, partial [Candidatus Gallimonas sp.]